MGDVTGFGLQEKEEVAVFLGPVIVGEESFLRIGRVIQVTGDFVSLRELAIAGDWINSRIYLFQGHSILNQQRNARIEISHILLEDEVLLRLGRDLGLEIAQMFLRCLVSDTSITRGNYLPLDKSSETSKSLSFADMDR